MVDLNASFACFCLVTLGRTLAILDFAWCIVGGGGGGGGRVRNSCM